MKNNNNTTMYWIGGVVAVLIIVLGIYSLTSSPSTDTENKDISKEVVNNINVVINDQKPGGVVFVTSATLSTPSFIVIHEITVNGNLGKMIGYKYFPKGTNPGKIDVSPETLEGRSYVALIHIDNGDNSFDMNADKPATDRSGKPITVVFRATNSIESNKQ